MTTWDEHETTTTIGELREGDFITVVPTQQRVTGLIVQSGIATITPNQNWRMGPPRRKQLVPGSTITTLSRGLVNRPDSFTVRVRRMVAS